MIQSSDDIALKLCAALGIEPTRINRMNLDLRAGEPAVVHVVRYLDKLDGEKLAQVLETYEVEKVAESKL